jgi:hypothetical protein
MRQPAERRIAKLRAALYSAHQLGFCAAPCGK